MACGNGWVGSSSTVWAGEIGHCFPETVLPNVSTNSGITIPSITRLGAAGRGREKLLKPPK
jgi:hypothetical protein